MIKNIFSAICGLCLMGVIVTLVILLVFKTSVSTIHDLDKSSKLYVDECIPAIVSTWSYQEALNRSSPELRKLATDDEVRELFSSFTQLGSLKTYQKAEGAASISYSGSGKSVTASYTSHSIFSNGEADIKVDLVLHDEKWQILSFRVESPRLFNK